jgi:hypothetical protein
MFVRFTLVGILVLMAFPVGLPSHNNHPEEVQPCRIATKPAFVVR